MLKLHVNNSEIESAYAILDQFWNSKTPKFRPNSETYKEIVRLNISVGNFTQIRFLVDEMKAVPINVDFFFFNFIFLQILEEIKKERHVRKNSRGKVIPNVSPEAVMQIYQYMKANKVKPDWKTFKHLTQIFTELGKPESKILLLSESTKCGIPLALVEELVQDGHRDED
eukprot:TRINITY_DN315_c1_g1_i2.p4 TRINITY_DN315_c1_g1~~TRINITY_DN315_c1_g1_i2.p4  ORF type:complete len:170 (-),score=52.48 TRINITY_DN315_c1_g1_i2:146-655(-)